MSFFVPLDFNPVPSKDRSNGTRRRERRVLFVNLPLKCEFVPPATISRPTVTGGSPREGVKV